MASLNESLLKTLLQESEKITDTTDRDVWAVDPVKFNEFVTDHLRLPPLSDRQHQDIVNFLGEDPKRIFPADLKDRASPFNLWCLLAGKGSGKDYMASIVVCYCFYLLLCMKDPQKYLGFPSGEAIDIVIVSYSAEQALLISFDKIKQRFKNWSWLRRNYSLFWEQKYITAKGRPEIHVHNEMIKSHNNIRIISEHSANESYEGYNILFFVMSESSAFKSSTKERNGAKVYNTLKTSASSRFPGKWKGMIMSFPRFDEDTDFTYLLYKHAVEKGRDEGTKTQIYPSKGAPWEFKPFTVGVRNNFYSGEVFEFRDGEGSNATVYIVPIEYKEEFETDPEDCCRKYLCNPGKIGGNIIPEDIILRALHDFPPLLEFENVVVNNMIQVILFGLEAKSRFVESYVATVDLGEVTSAAAVALQHLNRNNEYVLDALIAWTPNPGLGYTVDLTNVREILLLLGKHIPQLIVACDQWQSKLLRADLSKAGIKTLEYHTYANARFDHRDYKAFRQGMALGIAKILKNMALINQFKALRDVGGTVKLDTKISTRKDLVDAVIGGFKILMSSIQTSDLPGSIVSENLSQFGVTIGG